MEDFEFFPDEEEEAAEEEKGTNRTFIILVAVFGGILAIGICAFAVWGFVIYPRIQNNIAQNAIVQQTEQVLTAEAAAAPDQPEVTEETVPTETSPPPPLTEEPAATATPAEVAGATEEPTATLQPTQTRRPTVTPREDEPESTPTSSTEDGASEDEMPTTGIGAFGAGGVVVVLLVILVAARRLRRVA